MNKGNVIAVILVLIVSSFGYAQKTQTDDMKTLFGEKKGFGGYVELNSHYTEIADNEALLLGGGMGFVFGHSFNFGVKGYGMVTPVYIDRPYEERKQLFMGYGGFNLEPVLFSNSAVHVSVPVLLGVGGIAESPEFTYYDEYSEQFEDLEANSSDVFLVAEPGLMVELNLLKFMRISGGASYRFTDGVHMDNTNINAIDGINYDISLKFGWF